jgi:hypothetical protein
VPAVIYPTTLPGPSLSVVTPSERRLLSDVTGGPQQARGLQRDYLGIQEVEWSLLSATDAAAFDTWWKKVITYGGAWFASTWPAPQGWTSVVRRFIGSPIWTHLPGGFWSVRARVQVRGRGMPPWNYVVLLLHGDGTNGSTVFTDSSVYARTVTSYGSTVNSTSAAKFGLSSLYFNKVGLAKLSVAADTAYDLAAHDFTLEFFVYSLDALIQVLVCSETSNAANGWAIRRGFDGTRLVFTLNGVDRITSGVGSFPISTWHHVALTRLAGVMSLWLNGILVGTYSFASALDSGATFFGVEANAGSFGNYLNGYIDEVRIMIDKVAYKTAFTPPISPFPFF